MDPAGQQCDEHDKLYGHSGIELKNGLRNLAFCCLQHTEHCSTALLLLDLTPALVQPWEPSLHHGLPNEGNPTIALLDPASQ